ncbi:MAG: hypothetical protein HOI53_07510, partial [Francisellaceae bacterium]|nr:hypothetical protein [Francisellaceae bacterium]
MAIVDEFTLNIEQALQIINTACKSAGSQSRITTATVITQELETELNSIYNDMVKSHALGGAMSLEQAIEVILNNLDIDLSPPKKKLKMN